MFTMRPTRLNSYIGMANLLRRMWTELRKRERLSFCLTVAAVFRFFLNLPASAFTTRTFELELTWRPDNIAA